MADDTARIRIEDITPTPPDDVIAAIGLALEAGWPEPKPPAMTLSQNELRWRFHQRPWKLRRRS